MSYVLAGFAVYKMVQLLDALTPKEAMPWVKVLVGIVLGYGAAFVMRLDDIVISGLAIATVASGCHALLRLTTLVGDMALRRSVK